jgi:hypothetical protein
MHSDEQRIWLRTATKPHSSQLPFEGIKANNRNACRPVIGCISAVAHKFVQLREI